MIIEGSDYAVPLGPVHGVRFEWLTRRTLQLSPAPRWYSLRARLLNRLCGPCDLGLPVECGCPPSEPRVPRIITLPSL